MCTTTDVCASSPGFLVVKVGADVQPNVLLGVGCLLAGLEGAGAGRLRLTLGRLGEVVGLVVTATSILFVGLRSVC